MEWVRFDRNGEPRSAHKRCVSNFNACMSSGHDAGDCGDPACAMSARYDRAASEAARAERLAAKAAKEEAK